MRKTTETHQISLKADTKNVRHAEKFYTAGVIRVRFFLAINRVDYRHSRTYSFTTDFENCHKHHLKMMTGALKGQTIYGHIL